ncbi:response regulator transcription factor [Actinomycetospora endophytica]|uniref:Response regulator transcription factor n=1 Tax=Actinomycetospora endophytica TaxID=2291215 RepID=A0ABS8PCD7_9PSEU|nr:response regulator transcription factor [Actinomycetospora endophytica]MCD2195940.1 response regulator transcription factor [Actinomycetospora endophytica]
MTRVLLADHHRLFAELLGGFLAAHAVEVLGVATTAAETESLVRSEGPDLCLVDAATVAPADPAALVERLAATTRVVVLTGSREAPAGSLEAGAVGHLGKTVSGAEILAALDRIAHGEIVVSESGREVPAGPEGGHGAEARRRLAGLRARERECLELIAGGASTEDMALAMGVTPATVRSHVRAVLAALDVHSRLGAAAFALRHGVAGAPRVPADRAG